MKNIAERRAEPRYVAQLPVRAEWDDARSGAHVVTQGETENVGPVGALVHLPQLPEVGSRVRIAVLDDEQQPRLATIAEVLRLERHPGHPLAALQVVESLTEWRDVVWEAAMVAASERDSANDDFEP